MHAAADQRVKPVEGWPALRVDDRCAATGDPIPPGERYVAVLVHDADVGLRRLSFSASAWPADVAGEVVATWRTTMRDVRGQATRAGNQTLADELLDLLAAEPDSPTEAAMRYLAAMHLLRRQRVRLASRDARRLRVVTPDGEAVEVAVVTEPAALAEAEGQFVRLVDAASSARPS